MMSPEFQKKVKGNNGHYYTKMLKENITEELQLNKPTEASSLSFENLYSPNRDVADFRVDVEGKYNTHELSNLDTVGLEKLVKEGGESDRTVDKMLSEYFLQKRSQYKASNQLLDQLNKQFGDAAWNYAEGDPFKTGDSK